MAEPPRRPKEGVPSPAPPPGPPPWLRLRPGGPSTGAPPGPPSPSKEEPPPAFPRELVLPPEEPPRRRRWWLAAFLALFVYLLLALVTAVQPVPVAGLSLTVPIPGLPPARLFGLPNEPFTVLIVGLDVRPTQQGPSRTDSILLLRVDPNEDRAGLLSIPRDTLMQVVLLDGGFTEDRVNAAIVYNWSSEEPGRGLDALKQTIAHNLGLTVDYYLVFDQRDAAEVIDAAGGVTVEVKQAFGQEDYSDDDVHVVPQLFPEGKQHLNGYQAVAYGRIREGSSDFDRIQRQQQVAEGLVDQLSSPRNFWRLPGVYRAYGDGVETDLSLRQSAGVFALLNRAGSDRLVTRSLGDAAVSCSYCTASMQLLQPETVARLITEAFDDSAAGRAAAERLVSAGVTP